MSFVKTVRQFYITVNSLAAPELFRMSPCSGQRLELFWSGYLFRLANLLHLSNFRQFLAFPGFALKQKCCINFFPSVMLLFLLVPYIKKILSLHEYFTNIFYHQLSPALLVISGISIIREFSVLQYAISMCSEQYRKQRQIYYKKLMCKSEAESDKSISRDSFLKLSSWRSQEIQQADAIPKTY